MNSYRIIKKFYFYKIKDYFVWNKVLFLNFYEFEKKLYIFGSNGYF